MRILIESIPHKDQRYDTCGDYQDFTSHIYISVSELPDKREMLLIAIHELIEWALCDANWPRITNETIDAFDLAYRGDREPGDDTNAPYYTQHQIATGIERILAADMGVPWAVYEGHIKELKR